MQVNNLFQCRQFGSRSKMCTLQALADITEKIRNNIHLDVSCMLLDLQNAFDTINHEILLFKLGSYCVRGFCSVCIRSYLNGRTQCVAIIHQYSNILAVECATPQASIIGPLWFLIYVNNFPSSCVILYDYCTQMIPTACILDPKMLLRHFNIKLSTYRRGWQKIN